MLKADNKRFFIIPFQGMYLHSYFVSTLVRKNLKRHMFTYFTNKRKRNQKYSIAPIRDIEKGREDDNRFLISIECFLTFIENRTKEESNKNNRMYKEIYDQINTLGIKAFLEKYAKQSKKNKNIKLAKRKNKANRLKSSHHRLASKLKESVISRRLAKSWNAEREAPTTSGNIDLLTATKLIEVKSGNNWKHGIGQLIAYGFHKPDKHKVLYLFDYENVDLDNVRAVCRTVNIEVMLEP